MAPLHESFEWDEDKAESNRRKHGVTFDQAASALSDTAGDRYHLDVDDPSHAVGEERFLTFASLPERRNVVLIISWTDRSTEDEKVTRIISARRANKQEKTRYGREIGG